MTYYRFEGYPDYYRGVYQGSSQHGPGTGGDDSYPADHFSCVFGGGKGLDVTWTTGAASKFLVQPRYPVVTGTGGPPSECDKLVASTPHAVMVSAMMMTLPL